MRRKPKEEDIPKDSVQGQEIVREGHCSVDTMMLGKDPSHHNPVKKPSNQHQMTIFLHSPGNLRRNLKHKTINLHHSAHLLKQKESIAGRSSPCLLRKENSSLKLDQKLNQLKKDQKTRRVVRKKDKFNHLFETSNLTTAHQHFKKYLTQRKSKNTKDRKWHRYVPPSSKFSAVVNRSMIFTSISRKLSRSTST